MQGLTLAEQIEICCRKWQSTTMNGMGQISLLGPAGPVRWRAAGSCLFSFLLFMLKECVLGNLSPLMSDKGLSMQQWISGPIFISHCGVQAHGF